VWAQGRVTTRPDSSNTAAMDTKDTFTAIGLMSGTSMDGVDAAVLVTDGRDRVEAGLALTIAYDDAFRARLRAAIQGAGDMDAVEVEITDLHRDAVRTLMERAGLSREQVDIVGFHGHTVLHEPEVGRTRQIGHSQRLADHLGIDVVGDLRLADMAAGGQGAPVAPVFHRALAGPEARPVVVLNMGGVANVTWLGTGEADLLGFDTGPGNAPIDDWCWRTIGTLYDEDGALAKAGTVDRERLARMLADPYFDRKPPKSLDRDAFHARVAEAVEGLSPQDGAATLVAFSATTIAGSARWFPQPPTRWIATGGGRHNPALMAAIAEAVAGDVVDADDLGWDGDALEAQAFAYLAVRSILGLDITFPGTTGVAEPRTGGKRYFSSSAVAGTLASR
jgi:anhydro-N-acetylmuramic acid kinase